MGCSVLLRRRFLLWSAASALFPFSPSFAGGTAADFYRHARIRWIVPFWPGGGYDQCSRLIAPFFEKYTGARVEIVNMPGAGGMKGAVEIFRSPPDGLHIGIMSGSALVGNALAGTDGADYDATVYCYIGRISSEERVLVVSALSGLKSFEDIRTAASPVVIGATGLGGTSYVDSVVAARAFGYGQRLIDGFDASANVRLSMLRGEVTAMWGSFSSAAEGIETREFIQVLRTGGGPDPLLDGVPSVADFAEGFDAETQGLFAVTEMFGLWRRGGMLLPPDIVLPSPRERRRQMLRGMAEVFRRWPLVLRSSAIGTLIGVLPGIGSTKATFVAYGHAKQTLASPETFGSGNIEGVIAPEAASDADDGGTLASTFAFDIPGSSSMAILLSGLTVLGLQTGPRCWMLTSTSCS